MTSRECLIECSMVFGERAQADFEERLKNKKMKAYEVDETENRYEVKPLKPISTKTRWREILWPSVQVVGRGKRKRVFCGGRGRQRRETRHDDDDTTREEYTSTGRRRRRRVHVADKSGRFRVERFAGKYRKQYLLQVEMQKKKKKKKNMNRTGREEEEDEEEEAALTVERRSAPNVYRSGYDCH